VTAIILVITGILLFLARIVGAGRMMLAVMLVRPSCDRALDWLKAELGQQSGPGAAFNAVVIALAIAALAQAPELILSGPLLAWAGFLLAAAASLFYTPDLSAGLRALLSLITYAAVFALPYALIRSGKDAANCFAVALASSLIPSIAALLEIAMQPAILTGQQRLQSTFTHPNIYAFYLVGLVSVIIYINCSANIAVSAFLRRATFIYAGYLLLLLLLTQTRSAWVAMLLIVVGYSTIVDRRWLVVTLALPFVLLVPGVADRLADLRSGTIDAGFEQLNSLAWREVLWKSTFEWMAANPPGLLGYGLGSYKSYVPLFFSRSEEGIAVGAHNALLQIYFEMGIVGLTSFVLLMSSIAFKLLLLSGRDFKGSFTMLMLCAGYMLVAYSDNLLDYLQFQWFFWFTLGTVCASRRLIAYPSSHAEFVAAR
jgi:O-antigen ligase